jgi:pyruvate/2-oxoglutarate dehydrogenase complex dihydrolipoamide acyltransferase (E2) component
MSYYIATQHLPKVGDTSYGPGALVPVDAPGLAVLLSIGLVQEIPGEPPAELIPEPTPAAKEEANEQGVDVEELAKEGGSGKEGRVIKADVEEKADEEQAEEESEEQAGATAPAKELAEELGIELSEVEGTGADGRITKSDVEAYAEKNSEQ